MYDGVMWYTKAWARIPVFFPEGRIECRHCPFLRYSQDSGLRYCKFINYPIENEELNTQPKFCPVTEIEGENGDEL